MTWLGEPPARGDSSSGAPRCGCCSSPDTTTERSAVVRIAGFPVIRRFVVCPPCDLEPAALQGPWADFLERAVRDLEPGDSGGPGQP